MATYTVPVRSEAPPRVLIAAVPPFATKVTTLLLGQDPAYGGGFTVAGLVKVVGVPARRRVRLYGERTGGLAREAWSDATSGSFSFPGLARGPYTVVAYDYTGTYQVQAWNGVLAT